MSYLNNFHYQILNENHPSKLVFLHGLMGASTNWRKITSGLKDHFCILTFDQRGHGRSFHPPTGYNPEDYAEDLNKILDELGWDKITLVGHSMGGRNAMNFAHRFSHRVNYLVIEDIGPDINELAVEKTKRYLNLVPTPFADKKLAKQYLLEEFPGKIPENPQAKTLSQYFYMNIVETDEGTADWRFSKAGVIESLESGRLKDRWHEIKGLKMPTLIVRGANSDEISHETFLKMTQLNELIEGVEIEGAGHWVHSDQPKKFTECLIQFFQKHGLF